MDDYFLAEVCIAEASAHGDGAYVEWMRARGMPWDSRACINAIYSNHFALAQYMAEQGCPLDHHVGSAAVTSAPEGLVQRLYALGCPLPESACMLAAHREDLSLLRWLHEHAGCSLDETVFATAFETNSDAEETWEYLFGRGCPLDGRAAEAAASFANLDGLRWLRAREAPVDEGAAEAAAKEGHQRVLEWLCRDGCPLSSRVFSWAVRDSSAQFLERLREKYDCPWDARACAAAASANRLDVLRWLRDGGCEWDAKTFRMAARSGDGDMLDYLFAERCPWDPLAFHSASVSGRHRIAFRLAGAGCPVDEYTLLSMLEKRSRTPREIERYLNLGLQASAALIDCAVLSCSLRTLVWLRDRGCPLSQRTFRRAVRRGDCDVLGWLCDAGCPMDETAFAEAASHRGGKVLRLLKRAKCPWDARACAEAARRPELLRTLKWLRFNGCPWDSSALANAICAGNLEGMRWLLRKSCPVDTTVFDAAIYSNIPGMVRWAYSHCVPYNEFVPHLAAQMGNVDMLEFLRQKRVPFRYGDVLAVAIAWERWPAARWAYEKAGDLSPQQWETLRERPALMYPLSVAGVCSSRGCSARVDCAQWCNAHSPRAPSKVYRDVWGLLLQF